MIYTGKYPIGSKVKIVSRDELENFRATWKYHNKLSQQQIEYADQIAEITMMYMYHGGDFLYELRDAPGIWHEVCLRAANPNSL